MHCRVLLGRVGRAWSLLVFQVSWHCSSHSSSDVVVGFDTPSLGIWGNVPPGYATVTRCLAQWSTRCVCLCMMLNRHNRLGMLLVHCAHCCPTGSLFELAGVISGVISEVCFKMPLIVGTGHILDLVFTAGQVDSDLELEKTTLLCDGQFISW